MAHGQQFSICVRSRQAVLEWQQDCERFVRREVSPVTVQKHRSWPHWQIVSHWQSVVRGSAC